MNELYNTVTSNGNYNNIPTTLTSNTSIVNMVEGLSILKEANKKNWSDGNLMYNITLNNEAELAYTNVVVTDIIDNTLVDFVSDSVTINSVKAESKAYSYNNDTHTLTVNIGNIEPSNTSIITFDVKKKYNDFFILKSRCKASYNDACELYSNYVTVLSPIKRGLKNYGCGTPYWRS